MSRRRNCSKSCRRGGAVSWIIRNGYYKGLRGELHNDGRYDSEARMWQQLRGRQVKHSNSKNQTMANGWICYAPRRRGNGP
eukprot:2568540-Karenia_brevis.AAC.1